ncbi:MAG: NUDIX domain-containing protein [Bacteroidales bacterium]|nr:NUDIX domain-containing protein [Bacteroidales bacterium]
MKIAFDTNELQVSFASDENGYNLIAEAFARLKARQDGEITCPWRAFWNYVQNEYTYVKAAGGIVHDTGGNWLAIRHYGCWDLPKGIVDDGETRLHTAIREVQEETGADQLEVERLVYKSYHIHNLYGEWQMKQTTWYQMVCKDSQKKLSPQTEENIDQAVWLPLTEWSKRLQESYATMRQIVKIIPNTIPHVHQR